MLVSFGPSEEDLFFGKRILYKVLRSVWMGGIVFSEFLCLTEKVDTLGHVMC